MDQKQDEIARLNKTFGEKISSGNSMEFISSNANDHTEINKNLNYLPKNISNQNQNASQFSSKQTDTNETISTFNSTSFSDSKTRKLNIIIGHLNNNKKVKLDHQCEICEFSSDSLNGLRSHKGSIHGCKAIVSGVQCKKISCKTHVMVFDPRNRNGKTVKRKTNQCDMCQFSTFAENGVAIHKGKMHRCKYEDEYADRCKEMNCTKHLQEPLYIINDEH